MTTITAAPQRPSSMPEGEVASMVHDLRNPLTAIHGGAELLVGSRLSQPQIHRIARNMYGASLRMKDLLDELLSRWASRERETELCALRDLIAGAVEKIAVIAESQSVQIVQSLPDRLVIAVERHRMQSVVVKSLKPYWRVSIGTMILRCEHLGILSPEQSKRLWIYMNRKGWKKSEPLDDQLECERPRLLRRSFQMLVEDGMKARDQIVYDLRLTPSDMEEMAELHLGFFNGLDFAVEPKIREIRSTRIANGGVIHFPNNQDD